MVKKIIYETKGRKVYSSGRSADGVPTLVLSIGRNNIRELGIEKGDLVCFRLWKKPETPEELLKIAEEYKDPDITNPEYQESTKPNLTKEERAFLRKYYDFQTKGNLSMCDMLKRQAEESFGINRVKFLLKEGESLLPTEAQKPDEEAKTDKPGCEEEMLTVEEMNGIVNLDPVVCTTCNKEITTAEDGCRCDVKTIAPEEEPSVPNPDESELTEMEEKRMDKIDDAEESREDS